MMKSVCVWQWFNYFTREPTQSALQQYNNNTILQYRTDIILENKLNRQMSLTTQLFL